MLKPETCSFILLSDLKLSDDAITRICESALTFDRTLVTLARLNEHCSFDEEEETAQDQEILDAAIKELGAGFYVDLEN